MGFCVLISHLTNCASTTISTKSFLTNVCYHMHDLFPKRYFIVLYESCALVPLIRGAMYRSIVLQTAVSIGFMIRP